MDSDGTRGPAWECRGCRGSNPAGTSWCGHCGTPVPTDAEHEQRLVTALFADISGFTTLADSLDADALHRVISPVIGLLAGIAERYGGTLAKYAGDAVLVFFGAPVAQEDHAQRALRCALDMHRELAAALPHLPKQGRSLELHVGVNTGRVVSGMFGGDVRTDYSILGDAVNVAQRLESVAPPGQTYVGRTTQELAGAQFLLEPLGELTLKGKTQAVAAWRLAGQVGQVVGPRSDGVLVGRDRELAALRGLLGSTGGVATVVAEPGGGKSRLTAELARTVAARGARWLEGRALPYGASLPYWPVVDLLQRAHGIARDEDPELAAARLASSPSLAGLPLAVPVFGRLLGLPVRGGEEVDALSPEAFQRELGAALAGWGRALARSGPVVLLLEDLHWCDATSLDLLAQLVRALRPLPVLVVLSSRPEGEQALRRLVGDEDDRLVQLHLGPLDEAAVGAVATDVLGDTVADDLRALLLERTGGNPFFVQELVRALAADGSLDRTADGWSLSRTYDATRTPPTVEGVLAARLDQLPRPAAHLLQTASVIGRRIDLELLCAVAGDDVGLHVQLDQLVAAGFVDRTVEDGRERLTIHHALVVDVAYGRLVQAQRRLLHRQVAEAAEVLYGAADDVLDLLARHLYLADAGVKAVDHLERAAARAAGLFANEQAVLHLQRAVELVRRSPRMTSRLPRLLLQAADLEELVGRYDDALRDYAEAQALSGDVQALRGRAAVLRKQGRSEEAVALLDAALAQPSDGEDRTPLWLEVVAVLSQEGRWAEALLAARSGLDAAPPDSLERGHLLLRLARAQEDRREFAEALQSALEAQRLFEQRGDLRGLAFAHRVVGPLQAHLGQPERAVETLRRGLATAERTGSAEEVGGCLVNLGVAEQDLGHLDQSVDCARRAVALFESSGNVNGQATAHANLADALGRQGRFDEALAHGETGRLLAERMGARWTLADVHRTLALVHAQRGEPERAQEHAARAAEVFRSLDAPDQADEVFSALEAVDGGTLTSAPL